MTCSQAKPQSSLFTHWMGVAFKNINLIFTVPYRRFRIWNRARKVNHILRNLDDKSLKDIGIDRNKLGPCDREKSKHHHQHLML